MILVVGLSPAWQRTLNFKGFSVGEVNRAKSVTESAAGKGVNVARVAKELGVRVRLLTVAGGHRGELLARALRAQRISAKIVTVLAETRICQTVLVSGKATELVEEAGALTGTEVSQVWQAFERELSQARLVVLVGTVPPGCGEKFYARLVRLANARSVPVLIDAQKEQLINAISEKPFLVRINQRELAAATGITDVCKAARTLLQRGVKWVVVSRGPKTIIALHENARLMVAPPAVRVVNPIGSGDSMLAGMAVALWKGQSVMDALRLGVACGAANALTATSGVVRRADVARLLRQVG